MSENSMKKILMVILSIFVISCDCQRKNECEWKIEVDYEHQESVSKGFVGMCVRNYTLNKQKCYIEIEKNRVKDLEGKMFRYKDINIEYSKKYRRIIDYKTCQ